MHDTLGVILSQLNDSLIDFKAEHGKAMEDWYMSFGEIAKERKGPRAISDEVQWQLYATCHTDEQVQALMIYLVENCEVPLALVLTEIKAPFRRLGFALGRSSRLISA